ncbi:MAG: Heimdall-CTERM domain-containing surface protein [Candidatus Hodarchaeales archaeon]|jgi:hypothetical protein
MKKRFFLGISAIFLLAILSLTSPVSATEIVSHSFAEEFFAVELDLVGSGDPSPNDENRKPDLIRDLLNSSNNEPDSNVNEDFQFYLAYMNDSGIEVAFSALEKVEHDVTFGDLLETPARTVLRGLNFDTALDTVIFHVNATAPFQQLVQHYNTPEGEDVFVTNNFMALIAYSYGTGVDPDLMDTGDKIYLGYTLSVQEIIDAVNEVLVGKTDYRVGHFDYEASFEELSDGYKFGMKYTNMFVLWQEILVEPKGITDHIFGGTGVPQNWLRTDTDYGIVFGAEIAAASVLDYLSFDYTFKTTEFTTALNEKVVHGTVTTQYDIGETNFLITKDPQSYIDDNSANWTSSPFTAAPSYTFTIPQTLQNWQHSILDISIASSVTINLPDLAFYVNDDAKTRIKMHDGFGLTVATATSSFSVSLETPDIGTLEDNPDRIDISTYFFTEFTDKKTYKLLGLDELWGISNTTDRDVHIRLFDPSGWIFVNHPAAKKYFQVEFEMAYGFTRFVAKRLSPQLTNTHIGGDATVHVSSKMLYFTFTEFPEWYGGEIIHDPAYSAVAAVAAAGDSTDTSSGPPTSGGIPGFELLSVLLAIPPLFALYRKRRH